MEILSFLKPKKKKQFVSENEFTTNQDKQFRLSIESLVGLRDSGIEEEDQRMIDYFFYTDTLEKAQGLEEEIRKLGYIVNHGIASHNKNLFVVSGRTTPIKMMHESLSRWIAEMCQMGYKLDCGFDRWSIVEDSK